MKKKYFTELNISTNPPSTSKWYSKAAFVGHQVKIRWLASQVCFSDLLFPWRLSLTSKVVSNYQTRKEILIWLVGVILFVGTAFPVGKIDAYIFTSHVPGNSGKFVQIVLSQERMPWISAISPMTLPALQSSRDYSGPCFWCALQPLITPSCRPKLAARLVMHQLLSRWVTWRLYLLH